MNTYLPFQILEFPRAIFTSRGASKRRIRIQHGVFNHRVQQTPIPEKALQELIWHPEVVASLLRDGLMTPEEAAPLLKDPVFGFRVLVKDDGHLISWLEPQLLAHAEAAELILAWRRQAAGGPTQADDAYLECMVDDPNRLIRSLTPGPESALRKAQIVEESLSRKSENAAWAFCFLHNHPAAELDAEMSAVLASNDEYAYLAARVLRDRGCPDSVWTPLLDQVKNPRWVFHLLRDGLAGSRTHQFEASLMSSPPWMVEYWVAAGIKMPELGKQYIEASRLSVGHPCAEELSPWFQEYTIKVQQSES